MSNTLAQVRDLDAVKTLRPLALGLTGRFVQGVPAVLRRVLYVWYRAGLVELEGATLAPADRTALARQLERLAEDVDFVLQATVRVIQTAGSGELTIAGALLLVDGRTYPLELVASQARIAVLQLGDQPS